MTIRAVVWDLGGVLVRTEDYARRDGLARRLGISRLELENLVYADGSGMQAQLGEISIEQHWENVAARLSLAPQAMQVFQDEFWGGDRLDMELVDYIRDLHKRFKTGLLSNAFSTLRAYITQIWQFADAFDDMVISAEVGIVKPDARIYRLVLKRLEVEPGSAVFVDDFPHNVEAARALGMQGVHFQNRDQARMELEQILKSH